MPVALRWCGFWRHNSKSTCKGAGLAIGIRHDKVESSLGSILRDGEREADFAHPVNCYMGWCKRNPSRLLQGYCCALPELITTDDNIP